MEKDENVKEAYKKLKYLSKDEDMRRIAELKEKARRDAYGVEQFNIQKGFKQGIQHGSKKKSIEIAQNMLKKNMDVELIADITKLTIEEINKLKE